MLDGAGRRRFPANATHAATPVKGVEPTMKPDLKHSAFLLIRAPDIQLKEWKFLCGPPAAKLNGVSNKSLKLLLQHG
jgi:hypothetical protein